MAGPAAHNLAARDVAVRIVGTLRDAGHIAYFAGGCVRDELLGLTPSDYDVATDATPDRVAALFRRTALVGAHFGVVLVKAVDPNPHHAPHDPIVEVATFRADGAYSDRRRPDSVTFSDARADALRRDFTINAMFLDPLTEGPAIGPAASAFPTTVRGQVVDYVGGLADLASRTLRAVGDPDARLAEDHLRALRAVRLAARLGFAIEPGTAAAIRRHTLDLAGVSRERIGDEIRRILLHPNRGRGISILFELGLGNPVLGVPLEACNPMRLKHMPPDAGIAELLAAMALDVGHVVDERGIDRGLSQWRSRLCLSNEEQDGARRVLRSYFTIMHEFMDIGVAAQKRAAARGGFAPALRIVEHDLPARAAEVARRVDVLRATMSGLNPTALVTGDDLIRIGMTPGPRFARLLAAVYDAQLEDRFVTCEDGLRLVPEIDRGLGA